MTNGGSLFVFEFEKKNVGANKKQKSLKWTLTNSQNPSNKEKLKINY